ncbi:MAG: DUF502 domain-containing protein [Syntrophorhabdaceae bacterium]|nr:DUF502 domain-containing protein [Syntrophorhabdaceae bacterium]
MATSKHIKKTFITGIFILIPLVATAYIIYFIISSIDVIIAPLIRNITFYVTGHEIYIPGTGIIIFIVITYLTGMLASNYFGKKILYYGDLVIKKIPFVKGIYTSVKDIVYTFSSEKTRSFKEVVLVEIPAGGRYFLGFVTKRTKTKAGENLCSVFIPTTPNPTSGFLIFAREDDLIFIDMSVEDALKHIISLGLTQSELIWNEKRSQQY